MSGESPALSASTGQSSPGIRIDGPRVDDAARVLTPRALAFVDDLAAQATRAVYACAKLLDEKRRTRQ
jgi:hypothetical protein